MTTNNRANKASIHAVMGATGTAKTTHVMRCIKRGRPGRLLVWDAKGEFAHEGYAKPVTRISEVAEIIKKAGPRGRFALAFQPSGDDKQRKRDFSRLCLLAFYAGNVWLIAEELAEVTLSNWAPEGWRKVTTQGRSRGVTIYALSQSPAWVDKFFWGNCSTIRTGRLVEFEHAKTMAENIGAQPGQTIREMAGEIQRMPDGAYIHLQISPREIKKGNIFLEKK